MQQELMGHSDIRTTMNIYGAAMSESKREANSKVLGLLKSTHRKSSYYFLDLRKSRTLLSGNN